MQTKKGLDKYRAVLHLVQHVDFCLGDNGLRFVVIVAGLRQRRAPSRPLGATRKMWRQSNCDVSNEIIIGQCAEKLGANGGGKFLPALKRNWLGICRKVHVRRGCGGGGPIAGALRSACRGGLPMCHEKNGARERTWENGGAEWGGSKMGKGKGRSKQTEKGGPQKSLRGEQEIRTGNVCIVTISGRGKQETK